MLKQVSSSARTKRLNPAEMWPLATRIGYAADVVPLASRIN
jgi:hypothetical protein